MLITVSREYGAGGAAVARRVGERLGWRVVDEQFVAEVAKRAGLTTAEVQDREERGPTFVERVARALAAATPELLGPASQEAPEAEETRLARLTEQVVAEAASDHAVLVGRAAVAVVGRREDVLHVRLVAELAHRVAVIAARDGLDLGEAERRIRDIDAHRARYHRRWYAREWGDPRNYHLVLNTGWLGVERASDIVIAALAGR